MNIGSGVGGNVGGPIQPSVRELETTAATVAARANLKLAPDTLNLPLLEMDYDARRYQSSSNRPLLAGSLFFERVSSARWDQPSTDEGWHSNYDALVLMLPDDLRSAFLADLKLPPGQRNPNFV